MKPTLKAPEAKRLKLNYDELLSKFTSNFNLRRYTEDMSWRVPDRIIREVVGRCRLTLSNPS
jgi:hypothetical protein